MTLWLVEPRDPLIVREGRPFGPDPGAFAKSLPFPFPSTLAGGARTRSALDDNGIFRYEQEDKEALNRLKEIRIRGPLLVQLADIGDAIAQDEGEDVWLLPMPGDVQLFKADSKETAFLRRLEPLIPPAGAQTDFDEDERKRQLYFVGLKSSDFPEDKSCKPQDKSRKPLEHGLRYWYWHHFQNWLIDPTRLTRQESVELSSLGYGELVRERRFHVSMDSDREMGKDGLLFGTSGLEFTHPGLGKERLLEAKRLALAVDVEDEKMVPQEGVAGLGGERRLVAWRRSNGHLPTCHDDIKKAIIEKGYCRLILLTPAYFEQGYAPDWLCTTHAKQYGVMVELQAIAVRRPQVVSGWDLAISKPKPSRRLAPAGTVLFLSVQGKDDAAVSNWIENTWMQCISDDDQARRDGFGLAVLGTWSGQPVAM